MKRLPESMFSRIVMLALRQPDGEWWSSCYGGDTHDLWFFSTQARPTFGNTSHITAAFLLEPGEPIPEHQTGWWAAVVGIRPEQ